MKKYIMMSLSLLLIIAAMFFVPESINPQVIVGAGNGRSYNIETVDEFIAVMEYFTGQSSSSSTSSEAGTVGSEENARPVKHTSGTIKETSSVKANGVTLNRSLVVCMQDDRSYYKSMGTFNALNSTSEMEWDLEMLVDGENLYAKFNVFVIKANGEITVDCSDIIGKWVRFPDENMVQMSELIDSLNRQSLESVQMLVNSALEGMTGSGKVYSTKFGESTKITLDLTDNNSSTLSISANAEGASEEHFLIFSHIDNTVVGNDISDATILSDEMAEKLFGGV